MKDHNQKKRFFVFLVDCLLVIIQGLVFAILWNNIYKGLIPNPFWRRGNWGVVALYVIIFFVIHKLYGAFRIGYYRIIDCVYSQIIALLFVNAIAYIQISLINRWLVDARPICYMTVIQIAIGIIWALLSNYTYTKIYRPYKMIVICGKIDADGLVEKLKSRDDKYNISEIIYTDAGEDIIYEKIMKYEAVLISDVSAQLRNKIIKFCFRMSVRVYITPKLSDIIIMSSDRIHLFDAPLLLVRNQGPTFDQMIMKRGLDIVLSLSALILLLPMMLVIACLIKVSDGGPVFYCQERLTKGKNKFQIIKFRSMRVNSEGGSAKLVQKNDDRVTGVGKILRKTHFDELPQLINILKGEMSIVGPRPEREEIANKYQEEISEFDFRLKVKPGLTGYAQVYGQYNTSPYDKLKLDLFYIENFSILLDIKLMLLTIKILFQKEKSEGIEKGNRTALKKKKNL